MNTKGDSPLADMDDDCPVSLPLAAVEAMCGDDIMRTMLFNYDAEFPRETLEEAIHDIGALPDWVLAGLNCKDDEMILPICIHSYLLDWKATK